MITVHHLDNSRSQRVLWMLEELGAPYAIKAWQRDGETRLAPPGLKAVHPLGKSPVIEDDGTIVHESGAILQYLAERHGGGRLLPAPGTPEAVAHLQWMHYVEGSAMLPLMLALYVGRLGEAGGPLWPRIESEIANHLDYIAGALGERAFLVGEDLTAADVNLVFALEAASAFGKLGARANLAAYLARMQARPAYVRAIEKGGPYDLGGNTRR